MNREEIDDWLRYFSNNNQSFMSKDGKIITINNPEIPFTRNLM